MNKKASRAYDRKDKAAAALGHVLSGALHNESFVRCMLEGDIEIEGIEGLEEAIIEYGVARNIIDESHYEAAWDLIQDHTGAALQRLEGSTTRQSDIDELVAAIEMLTDVATSLHEPQPDLGALVEILNACSPWEPEVLGRIEKKLTSIVTRRNKAAMKRSGSTATKLKHVRDRLRKVAR